MHLLRHFWADDSGATAIEYGLIATLISLAAIAGIGKTATALHDYWDNISAKVSDPTADP